MLTEFSIAEIHDAARAGRLLALEVEVGLGCEGGCSYCRPDLSDRAREKLSHRELEGVLVEARDCGARRISFLPGEWSDYPHLAELVAEVRRLGLQLEVFVGSLAMDEGVARLLATAKARVVVSLHGVRDETHDRVCGREGSAAEARHTIERLRGFGYPEHAPLAVQTSICRANLDEIVPLWRWARSSGFVPYLENGERREDDSKVLSGVDPQTLEALFWELAEIDRTEFGEIWEPQPPWPGRRDLRHKYSCSVSASGAVFPPGLIPLPIGNLRPHGLGHVLRESEVLENLRVHETSLKGPCRCCELVPTCAGSRAISFARTGDYLASDPSCWRNIDQQERIIRLPAQLEEILPQKAPMRFVDCLVTVGDRIGECMLTIRDDLPMVEAGVIDDVAYLEIIAQAMAGLEGFAALETDSAGRGGFLVGAEALEILETARVGEQLRVIVTKDTRFGSYGIVSGAVYRGDVLLARGQIKVWRESSVPGT